MSATTLPTRLLFAGQKGGVGKTATAVNTAAAAAAAGARVLLVDLDPNGGVAAGLNVALPQDYPGIYGLPDASAALLRIPGPAAGLDLLPYAADRRPLDVARTVEGLAVLGLCASYDLIVIDSRPSSQGMARALCDQVDEVVVVFQCHHLAFRTLCGILTELRDARRAGAPGRLRGLLLTRVRETPEQTRLSTRIRASLGRALLPVWIPDDPAVVEAFHAGVPLVISQPSSPAAAAYRGLADSLRRSRASPLIAA